jgi:predicted pyridoxine 5'-phosphate oxidase superfamily flavin-nucleotide-binding protein
MTTFYGPNQRKLQDRFETRRLADKIEPMVIEKEVSDQHREFISARDMFWLASVDLNGQPTVSYKGGDPGFVKVLDNKTLAFPCYDGNGMFLSMGNLIGNPSIGMLFIDFESPYRLRIQGSAQIDDDDPLLADYVEAQLVVRITVSEVFRNCPRYVHRLQKVEPSKYVPRGGVETPLASFKRIDDLQEALPQRDRERVAREGGVRSYDEPLCVNLVPDTDGLR